MKLYASGEDYLEAVLVLQRKQGMVRSVDLARHMGFSKPSISHAVGVLKNGGFLTVDDDGFLHLTVIGREIAEKIYERHLFFKMCIRDRNHADSYFPEFDCRNDSLSVPFLCGYDSGYYRIFLYWIRAW